MNESSNYPGRQDDQASASPWTAALRQPSFLRVMLGLAAAGGRAWWVCVLAAPMLNPIIFAVVLALLFGPIYSWLTAQGFRTRWRWCSCWWY